MTGAPTASLKNTFPPSFQENTASAAAYYGNAPAYNSQAYYQPVYTQQSGPQNPYTAQTGAAAAPPPQPSPYTAMQPGFNAYSAQSTAYGSVYGSAPTAYTAQPPQAAAAAYSAYRGPTGPSYAPPNSTSSGYTAPPVPTYPVPTASTQPANTYVPTKPAAPMYSAEPAPVSTDVQPLTTMVQTTGSVLPNSQGVKGRANVPMGVVYSLMREATLPVVNPQGNRLVRCSKCRAYMNCYVQFSENGSKWSCNLCATVNEVPNEYYCSLTASGERQDKFERAELHQAAVEFLASPDYMTRPPMAPTYVLLLDVSRSAVQSGFVHSVCQTFKTLIQQEKFAGVSRAQFAVLTYDANIHLYTPGAGDTPQISVITGNSKDVFLPSGDLVIHIKDNLEKLTSLLDNLPTYWLEQTSEESCVAGALTAARLLLRSCGGKVIMCQCALPLAPELGLNPNHDMRKKDSKGRVQAHGSLPDPVDGVKSSSPFFSNLAATLAGSQISVDLFVAPATPIQMDLATLGGLARYSGGQLYYYPPSSSSSQMPGQQYQQPHVDLAAQLMTDLETSLSSVAGWEGVMRVRCSKGWKISKYHGNYCFRALDLIMLPSFVNDQTVSVQFDISDAVTTDRKFYAQAAVLYTTPNGERRIRVVNHSVQTTPNLRDVANGLNLLPTLYLIAQNSLDEAANNKLADGRGYIHNQTRHLTSLLGLLTGGNAATQEAGEAAQQQCQLFSAALMKCSALRDGRDVTADERVMAWNKIRSYTTEAMYNYLLPVLMEVSQLPQDSPDIKPPHPRFS